MSHGLVHLKLNAYSYMFEHHRQNSKEKRPTKIIQLQKQQYRFIPSLQKCLKLEGVSK